MLKKMTKEKKERRRNPRDYTQKAEREERKTLIKERVDLYKNALRIPPSINQFNTTLNEDDTTHILDFFLKYRPENRNEKKKRLQQENPREGIKPVLSKCGIKHVVSLIEQKKAKLVLIAADVDPIEIVAFLPVLCKKMGVSYALVKSKSLLGPCVNLKKTSCLCLCDSNPRDSLEFKKIINKCNNIFMENYEDAMRKWGGGVVLKNE